MPDHAHILIEGTAPSSSALTFVSTFKRRSAYHAWSARQPRLWQVSFFDRVLRAEEDALQVASYIVANPVRAGLTRTIGEYAWAGSDVYSMAAVTAAIQELPWR